MRLEPGYKIFLVFQPLVHFPFAPFFRLDIQEMGEKQLRKYLVPGTCGPGNDPLPPKRVRSRKK